MAKIVLHIGAHKTATSYLQAVFHRNRSLLQASGLYYPYIGPNNAHHALAGQWFQINDLPEGFYGPAGPVGLWDEFIKTHVNLEGTLFLSAENFTRVYPHRVNMAELAERLAVFEEVRIVYTLRRQVELIPSVWAQISKMNFVPSVWTFMRTVFDERRAKGVPIDHNAVYHELLTGFAPEQIHLLDYSRFRAHPAGVVGVFLDLLGVAVDPATLVQPPEDEANISPDPLALFIASQIVGPEIKAPPPHELVANLQGLLDTLCTGPRTLLAKHEYAKVKERFRHGNQTLVDSVQPYQPGFSFDEGTTPEGLFYRDDLNDQAWIKIAAALYAWGQNGHSRGAGRLRSKFMRH
ncbi:MAG: hypothetical protein RQ750_16120 [Roseovarius sp.]|nr:hypothetical protein [Roseovarius sp.]